MPSPSYVFALILFSVIGGSAWLYGKRAGSWRAMTIGIGLMGYFYVVSNLWAIYGIGIGLTIALFVWRD